MFIELMKIHTSEFVLLPHNIVNIQILGLNYILLL